MDTPNIALAALIIACIALVGSLITDSVLLYEYSEYVDFKDRVKSLMRTKIDINVMRRVMEQMAQKMADAEASQQETQTGTTA
jgi:hypothetical protein